ncbi:hypothetical protein BH10PSE12_BH10PSE12_36320 [soil metagenome]
MERREHFNEEPGITGEMSFAFDVDAGHVWAFGSGFWSVRQAGAFFADWTSIIRRIHATGQVVSALVDMSASAVQKAEVVDIIARGTAGLYENGDTVAMLLASSLSKMQMRRVHDPRFHQFFISRNAAETWLEGRSLSIQNSRTFDAGNVWFREPLYGH